MYISFIGVRSKTRECMKKNVKHGRHPFYSHQCTFEYCLVAARSASRLILVFSWVFVFPTERSGRSRIQQISLFVPLVPPRRILACTIALQQGLDTLFWFTYLWYGCSCKVFYGEYARSAAVTHKRWAKKF